MESNKKNYYYLINWYKNLPKSYSIIGSNIGPIYTKSFIKDLRQNVFKNADYVCLRDKKSYDYVSDLNNVNVASDIVFTLNLDDYDNVPIEKKVIFSVIDVNKKAEQMKNPDYVGYINLICSLIRKYYNEGYKIQLMSFCAAEGDEEMISSIINKLQNIDIDKYFYKGDIDESLRNLASAEIIVGTRFHANILGLLMEKKIVPIAYNDKTINFLNDINFNGSIIDINNLKAFSLDNLNYSSNKINIDELKNSSYHHFYKLDEMLKRSKTKNE